MTSRFETSLKTFALLLVSAVLCSCGKVWVSLNYQTTPSSGPITYQLIFSTQPSSSVAAGSSLATGGVIKIEDNSGNLVTSGALSSATIMLSDASNNGGIAGVTSVTAVGGIATIPNNTLEFEKDGTTDLHATTTVSGFGTLSADSGSVTIAAPSFSAVSLLSGVDNPNATVDGTGTSARLWKPSAVTSDGTNVYILENWPNCVMREYNIATGAVSTLAGQLYSCGFTDGAVGTNTIGKEFVNDGIAPITTDGTYVYFVDGYAIRRVTISNGTVSTIAGSATTSGYVDNSTGTTARFGSIGALYLNSTTLYVADNGNHYIRTVDLSASPYAVATVAGNGTGAVLDNSSPLSAEVKSISYFSADGTNLYFNDNDDIRQMAWTGGAITTDETNIGGTQCGSGGFGAMAVIGTTMYLSCQSKMMSATIGTWTWSTVAGAGWTPAEVDGATGTSRISYGSNNGVPMWVQGTTIYLADTGNGALRSFDSSTGDVTTLAGTPNSGQGWVQNTTSANSRFDYLQDMVSDGTNIFSFDFNTNLFPVISMANGSTGTALGSTWGFTSPASQVLAYMGGKIYYSNGCEIYTVDPYGDTETPLAGNGTCAETEGSFSSAQFMSIGAIATDQNNLYVMDNNAIKKLDFSTDTVSVISGLAGTSGCTTGSASASRYGGTSFMTYMNGKLYFTEYCNSDSIVSVDTTTGNSSVVAGNGSFGYVDGALASAEFGNGYDYGTLPITSDGQYLYVDDNYNGAVRKIDISGNSVSTLFGSSTQRWQTDGVLSSAREGPDVNDNPSIYYGYGKLYIGYDRGIRVAQ